MPSSLACTCLSCPAHDRVQSTPCPVYPTSSITDAQWAVLAPLLPPPGNTAGRGGRPEKHPRRVVLDAIFYLVRGGIAWAALPRDFPPHQTVYGLFGRWARQGMFAGTPFALAHTFGQTGPFRPSNVEPRLPGMFFAGSGTVPGVGVPMVLISGKLAASRVAAYLQEQVGE